MNKLVKNIFFHIIALLSVNTVIAQEGYNLYDYSVKKEYEIGGVAIEGAGTRDKNAIKSITGLREGNKITIPGTDIPKAVKALMKLRLFENVEIYQDSVAGDVVFLKINIIEKSTLSKYFFTGVKTSQHEELNDIVKDIVTKEGIVTEDQLEHCESKIKEFYIEKGKLDVDVEIKQTRDPNKLTGTVLEFAIKPGDRVKIESISFDGNKNFSDRKLRKQLKKTKQKGTIFKKTKYIAKEYEEDKENLIKFYNKNGYKNARIESDTLYRESKSGDIVLGLKIFEGNVFHIRDIKWKGNTIYTTEQLANILGIGKGDVYNPELLENRLRFSQDGRDISSLFLDEGYLGFNIDPVEISVENDSIDLEMRIYEGPQFTIENVVIKGNDRTNENVIRRELRTKPGQKFSRSQIIRSNREIINLGYFNPENVDIQTPVNQARGTVDIVYKVEERSSDQLELSAGYGGFSGLIGTLGVTFNNFSIKNIKDRSTWSPLPQGDGQKLSVRVQSNSRFFRSYNFSFTEPWLGGKKPQSFSVGAVASIIDQSTLGAGKLSITRLFAGIGSQMKWPDDFFSQNTTLNIENIALDNYNSGSAFFVDNTAITSGNFKNIYFKHTISRSSISDPLFPRNGSRVTLAFQFTPPYSLFRKIPTKDITDAEREAIRNELIEENGPAIPPTEALIDQRAEGVKLAKRYEFLEYHKWNLNAEWYFNLIGKLVFTTNMKFGFLGSYTNKLGSPPVERFEIGGDGLTNQNSNQLTGRTILALRGYEVGDFQNNRQGASVFSKYTMELRYPISLNPNSTIYTTAFLQGGNSWNSFKEFRPFDLKRSAGMGLRVFLPMFGLLGADYGFGFDKNLPAGTKFSGYGKFSVVIGFEPE